MEQWSIDTGRYVDRRRIVLLLLPLILASLSLASPAFSAEIKHLNWRQPQQVVQLKSLEVGDVPGHVLSIGESRGQALFKDGEIGSVLFKYIADYTRGTGPFWGYSRITFKDGSRIFAKYQAFTTAMPDGRTTFKGRFIFTKGTGRFRGIRGNGHCTGGRRVVHAQGARLFFDNSALYTLQSK